MKKVGHKLKKVPNTTKICAYKMPSRLPFLALGPANIDPAAIPATADVVAKVLTNVLLYP